MRILWVKADLLHPATSGGRIRTLNMLRALRRTHHISYVALDDGSVTTSDIEQSREYAQTLDLVPHPLIPKEHPRFYFDVARRALASPPVVLSRYRSDAWRARIEATVAAHGPFDLGICDFLTPALSFPSVPFPVVLFQHNVEARIWRRRVETARGITRLFYAQQHRKLVRWEGQLSHQFDGVVAVSESDAAEMREAYALPRVGVVDTGVDTNWFRPTAQPRTPGHLVFLGSMDWMPNIDGVQWFVRDILPQIQAQVPGVTLSIVGRSPTAEVRALASDAVTVTGTVDDVRPYLAKASALVVPLRVGGGTRIKLFEGLAAGVPTVSTRIGAEGLPVVDGEHVELADTPEGFASRVVALLDDPARAARLSAHGAALVQSRFSWDAVAAQFLEACAYAVGRPLTSAAGD
jgi:glycosyltransferase involved in cell wall biosynthesis